MTMVEFIVKFDPKLTVLTPLMKLVPVNTTLIVSPQLPLFGEIPVNVGAGLFTVKPLVRVAVPPPGGALVT